MKVCMLLPGLLFSAAVFAQSGTPRVQLIPLEDSKSDAPRLLAKVNPNENGKDETLSTMRTPNGNLVISLRQDNMPCVVPDTSIYNMPVVRPSLHQSFNAIPNPAYPPANNRPSGLDRDLLKKLQEKRPRVELNP